MAQLATGVTKFVAANVELHRYRALLSASHSKLAGAQLDKINALITEPAAHALLNKHLLPTKTRPASGLPPPLAMAGARQRDEGPVTALPPLARFFLLKHRFPVLARRLERHTWAANAPCAVQTVHGARVTTHMPPNFRRRGLHEEYTRGVDGGGGDDRAARHLAPLSMLQGQY